MGKKIFSSTLAILIFLCLASAKSLAWQEYLTRFEEKVHEFSLKNGLKFIFIQRDKAPVASFVTFVNAGSVDEPAGRSGLAHILEHMAFKGTKEIGTRNWKEEKQILERIDKTYHKLKQEKSKQNPNPKRLEQLKKDFQDLREKSKKYVQANEFSKIIERHGGTNLNAGTSSDYTIYFCSLPANKAELWFSLESDRLMNPVWREFYTEKEVILEERRMRVDTSPTGKLVEKLLGISFLAHPYGNPVIGWESDIQAAIKKDLDKFYSTFYVPQNMVMAISGDLKLEQVKAWAKKYFSKIKPASPPPEVVTKEPKQKSTRQISLQEDSEPIYIRAYHTVDILHKDSFSLRVLGDILASGRLSRFYKELVVKDKLAMQVHAFNGFPGKKYPGLFVIFAVPNKGIETKDLAQAIDKELEKIRKGKIEKEELKRAKTNIKANMLRQLDSNLGLAKTLAKAEVLQGDWRKSFSNIKKIETLTCQDIQEVAQKYLKKTNMNIGIIENSKPTQGSAK